MPNFEVEDQIQQVINPRSNNPLATSMKYLLPLLLFLLTATTGYMVAGMQNGQQAILVHLGLLNPNPATVIAQLTNNPRFTNWSARVSGRVTEKRKSSFVLSQIKTEIHKDRPPTISDVQNGQKVTILYYPPSTTFATPMGKDRATIASEGFKTTEYEDLKTGVIVQGVVDGLKQQDKWYLIGRDFYVQP